MTSRNFSLPKGLKPKPKTVSDSLCVLFKFYFRMCKPLKQNRNNTALKRNKILFQNLQRALPKRQKRISE